MNRQEALRRLKGTWTYELRDGRVPVRDLNILRAIEAIHREGERDARRERPAVADRALLG